MINILYEKLPDAVEVSGNFYNISTDFRDWIAFFDMYENQEIDLKTKMVTSFKWFEDEIPTDIKEAYNSLINFASCKDIQYINSSGNSSELSAKAPVLSWLYDSTYILGAFLEIYNIDLIDIEYMHWWKFHALFEALPEETLVKKRMAYRSIQTSKIKDKERRKQIVKIKKSIAFPHAPLSAERVGEVFG